MGTVVRVLLTLVAFVQTFLAMMAISYILSAVIEDDLWGFDFSIWAPPYLFTSVGLALVLGLFSGWRTWRKQR